jgi:ParB family chromosome partitioning protein
MARVNLASLAREDGADAPAPAIRPPGSPSVAVPVRRVALNPINPRELDPATANLSDLESMKKLGQLQACTVVTAPAFLEIYPEHAVDVDGADWVVVAGSRRRLAVERFQLGTLKVDVRDDLATDRATFYATSISENVDREGLNPIEEARAVDRLVRECGSGAKAAEIMGKTEGWISQRRGLLRLVPDLADLVRAGELPVRAARRLAPLPAAEQMKTWKTEQEAAASPPADEQAGAFTAVKKPSQPARERRQPDMEAAADGAAPGTFTAVKKIKRRVVLPAGADARMIARLLREDLEPAILAELVDDLLAERAET